MKEIIEKIEKISPVKGDVIIIKASGKAQAQKIKVTLGEMIDNKTIPKALFIIEDKNISMTKSTEKEIVKNMETDTLADELIDRGFALSRTGD